MRRGVGGHGNGLVDRAVCGLAVIDLARTMDLYGTTLARAWCDRPRWCCSCDALDRRESYIPTGWPRASLRILSPPFCVNCAKSSPLTLGCLITLVRWPGVGRAKDYNDEINHIFAVTLAPCMGNLASREPDLGCVATAA